MEILFVVSDRTKAKCKSCNKVFNLSNMGKQALVSHAEGKKHIAVTAKVQGHYQTVGPPPLTPTN